MVVLYIILSLLYMFEIFYSKKEKKRNSAGINFCQLKETSGESGNSYKRGCPHFQKGEESNPWLISHNWKNMFIFFLKVTLRYRSSL